MRLAPRSPVSLSLFALLFLTCLTTAPACDSDPGAENDTNADTDNDTEQDGDQCVAPDPSVSPDYSLDRGEWPLDVEDDTDDVPDLLDIAAADCVVDSFAPGDSSSQLQLLCSEGEQTDMPIGLRIDSAHAAALALESGDALVLSYKYISEGYHSGAYNSFALLDADGRLLAAGLDGTRLTPPKAGFGPLSLASVADLCAAPCDGDEFDCSEPERVGVEVTHTSGDALLVLDQGAGELATADGAWRVEVGTAERWFCINCEPEYKLVIVALP
jgi:hypothetical protein